MNIHDWHRNGLVPPFATVEQWLIDQLGLYEAEDEACYALAVRDADHPAGLAVRILICADVGLFDVLWERPEKVTERRLVTVHHRWPDVRGLHLSSETRLDPETLMHGAPRWRLEAAEPEFVITEPTDDEALLEFWQACTRELDKVNGA